MLIICLRSNIGKFSEVFLDFVRVNKQFPLIIASLCLGCEGSHPHG
ncbi:unnamed protein product [Linum tenue]|uniref:Uncharacterized protein n=1 Tax=Linum tenue TaxID=586396 RepID=A0AAV0NSX0_9ROSI|nr:unnamed protein product [Linum tenue]